MTAGDRSPGNRGGRTGAQWIVFKLGETEYVVDSKRILQIEMVERITPVPNARPFVRGVAYLRGQVVPVIDLRVRLGLPTVEPGFASRLIVVGVESRPVGLLVDAAREVVYLDETDIEPPPDVTTTSGQTHVSGIAVKEARVLLALDVDKVLETSVELAPLSEIDAAVKAPSRRRARKAPPEGEEQGGGNHAVL